MTFVDLSQHLGFGAPWELAAWIVGAACGFAALILAVWIRHRHRSHQRAIRQAERRMQVLRIAVGSLVDLNGTATARAARHHRRKP